MRKKLLSYIAVSNERSVASQRESIHTGQKIQMYLALDQGNPTCGNRPSDLSIELSNWRRDRKYRKIKRLSNTDATMSKGLTYVLFLGCQNEMREGDRKMFCKK